MKVDRFTKAMLMGIFLCLVLLTLKEYDIISDAEAANPITDVNIKQISGKLVKSAPTQYAGYNGLPVVIYAMTKAGKPAFPIYQDGQARLQVKAY